MSDDIPPPGYQAEPAPPTAPKPTLPQVLVTAAVLIGWLVAVIGPMAGLAAVAPEDKLAIFSLVTLVVGYWIGSSAGSAAKDAKIERILGR
jgi:hypothetical protein